MAPRPSLRSLAAKTHWLRHKARSVYDAVANWADTPEGRLTRWGIGILIVLVLAGHG